MSSDHTATRASTPIVITILSNDIAFFTDTNIDSHKRALTRLWERMRPHFECNLMQSISIIIFESKVSAIESNQSNVGHTNNEEKIDHTPHRFKVAYCAREIEKHIIKLSDKQYKQIQGNQEDKKGMPLNIQFEMKDFQSIYFSSILQQWSREILHSSTADFGRICFELPETFDGTQSAVTLDLSYSILPYRIHSPMAERLLDDLKDLSDSHLEAIQLAPLDSIDLSLIYGTPLTATAGFVDDIEQYKQMKVLVHALFDYIGSNDVALVLKSSKTSIDQSCEKCDHGQLFLLMAQIQNEEKGEKTMTDQYKAIGKGHGILCRYVQSNDQIIEAEQNDRDVDSAVIEDDDLLKDSSTYIETSLQLLECLNLSNG